MKSAFKVTRCAMADFGRDSESQFNINDIAQNDRLLELAYCSKSKLVAFTLKTDINARERSSTTSLWIHDASSLQSKQMSSSASPISNPVFATEFPGAEDSIMFIKSTDGQVYTLPLHGGEASRVTALPLPIESFKVFLGRDNQPWLLVVLNIYPSSSPEETVSRDKTRASASTGIVFDRLMIRHWDTWNLYEKRNHLFLIPLIVSPRGLLVAENRSLDVMSGIESDCPSKSPGHSSECYDPSPSGALIALSCRGDDQSSMAWSTESSIYLASVPLGGPSCCATSTPLRRLTSLPIYHGLPTWAPDSTYLAFTAMSRPQYESDRCVVYACRVGEDATCFDEPECIALTSEYDISIGSITWEKSANKDESVIFATAQLQGCTRIFKLGISHTTSGPTSSAAPSLTSIAYLSGDVSRNSPIFLSGLAVGGQLTDVCYYLESSLVKPPELKRAYMSTARAHKNLLVDITGMAGDKLHTRELGEVPLSPAVPYGHQEVLCPCPQYSNGETCVPTIRQFYITAPDEVGQPVKDPVHIWYIAPAAPLGGGPSENFDADALPPASTPLLLFVHGGPQGAFLNAWNVRWNLALYAAQGFAVVAVNFHGSTGFGQAFTDSIRGDWGGQPYRDIMAAVDFALAHFPYLSPDRLGALGASYGGYMINWINGHTNRFKCLVNHDGIFSLRALYYTTDELWFPEWEFGLPFALANSAQVSTDSDYDKFSPERFVHEWRTPCLVIQGGRDYRVVETEAIATFTALQRKRIPSRMLYFHDENHWCLKAINSIMWHDTVFAWLGQWLVPASNSVVKVE